MNIDQRQQKIKETAQIISKINDESEFNESVLKIIKDLGLDIKPESNEVEAFEGWEDVASKEDSNG
jgi:hypothetical protein